MSKHRKNHAAKVASFKRTQVEMKNRITKEQKKYYDTIHEMNQRNKMAYVLETVYHNNNALVKEINGLWYINIAEIEVKYGILYWKSNGNPVVAGLASIDEYTKYTLELCDDLLKIVQQKLIERNQMNSMSVKPVQQDDIQDVTFDLVEDK
jgi:hypothetical protein